MTPFHRVHRPLGHNYPRPPTMNPIIALLMMLIIPKNTHGACLLLQRRHRGREAAIAFWQLRFGALSDAHLVARHTLTRGTTARTDGNGTTAEGWRTTMRSIAPTATHINPPPPIAHGGHHCTSR